jgi:hypothetical protein
MGQEVVQVVALAAGELRLEFSDGTVLTKSPHPMFEAWEIRCDQDPVLWAAPGGGSDRPSSVTGCSRSRTLGWASVPG